MHVDMTAGVGADGRSDLSSVHYSEVFLPLTRFPKHGQRGFYINLVHVYSVYPLILTPSVAAGRNNSRVSYCVVDLIFIHKKNM